MNGKIFVSTQPFPLWTKGFIMICLAHVCMTVGFYASMPVYAMFLEDRFTITGIALGAAVACYTASAILFRMPAGYCLDAFGRKRIYLASYILFGLLYVFYPLAESIFSVSCVRILHGALWGISMGAANTVAVDLLPAQRRGEGIGYFGLTMILSMSIGPAFGTWLATEYGYDAMFLMAAGLALFGFLIILRLPFPNIPREAEPLRLRNLIEPHSLRISLTTLIYCIPYGIVMNFTNSYARTIPGASAGSFFFAMALGTATTRIFCGQVFDRSGPGRIMLVGLGCMVLGYCLLAFAGDAVVFTLGGLGIGFGYGIAITICQASVNSVVPPQRRGAANGTFMTAFDLGICIGLLVISPIQHHFGWFAVYCILVLCICLSAIVFLSLALPHYKALIRARDNLK
ncbi:MAG: MFS transporter [Deltaproteobacteria bacterium]|jgi:MFS family permease|nr:MFS transporter [Deltaproteobacteria bacterium]